MATLERDILDKVGKYNLQELSIISYSQDKEESKPKFIDIKGITYNFEIAEDIKMPYEMLHQYLLQWENKGLIELHPSNLLSHKDKSLNE